MSSSNNYPHSQRGVMSNNAAGGGNAHDEAVHRHKMHMQHLRLLMNRPTTAAQHQQQPQQEHGRYSIPPAASSTYASEIMSSSSSSSSCPPYITPTLPNRPRLSLANAQALLCKTSDDIERSLLVHQNNQSQRSIAASSGSVSASSSASPSSTMVTLPNKQNPLDLLSAVSSHVLASNERRDDIQWQQNRQRQPPRQSQPPPPLPPYNNSYSSNNNKSTASSSSSASSYIGQRNSSGQRHGHGILTYPNGCHYNGCFHNDKRHGFGKCYYPNGCIYTGFWSHGTRDGVGKMIYPDRGDMYEGEWKEDQRHGRGIYYRHDGRADVAIYVHHDTMIGEGVQWSPNREYVVKLVEGVNWGPISVQEALEICAKMGIPGVPKRYENWAEGNSNNNSSSNSDSHGRGGSVDRSANATSSERVSGKRHYSSSSI